MQACTSLFLAERRNGRKNTEDHVHTMTFQIEFRNVFSVHDVVESDMCGAFRHAFAHQPAKPKHVFVKLCLPYAGESDPTVPVINRQNAAAPSQDQVLPVNLLEIHYFFYR